MQENNVDRVHRRAELMIYDLELSDSVRHPVRFFSLRDILRAAGEEYTTAVHHSSCNCRFCVTDLLNTRILKPTLP